MYCKNCGKEIDEQAVVCPYCGVAQQNMQQNFNNNNVNVVDNGGIGWGLLGCCIPIVGLILFLVWKDTKPKTSKAAGIGALVAVVCYALFYAVLFFIGMSGANSYY